MTVGVLISGLQHERGRVAESPSAAVFTAAAADRRLPFHSSRCRTHKAEKDVKVRKGLRLRFSFIFGLQGRVIPWRGGGSLLQSGPAHASAL